MAKKTTSTTQTEFFRAGVGAVILNDTNQVLIFRRKGTDDSWQFPQGGLDVGEEPLDGVTREIWEETGITAGEIELLPFEPPFKLLAYEIPPEFRSAKTGRGQTQRWYFFKFTGSEESITFGDGLEFERWKWVPMDEAVDLTVAFKRGVYRELARHLAEQII